MKTERYRTIWLSDIHLGFKSSRADLLISFLRKHDADTYYLVGDIVDGWQLKRTWHWLQEYNDLIQKMLRKVRKGARMYYIPGNHDEFAALFIGENFGGVELCGEMIHTLADGRRLLVMHGHQFDLVVRCSKWLTAFGNHAYDLLLMINYWYSKVRRALGRPAWSLSAHVKQQVKNAVMYVSDFEHTMIETAQRHHADGIVCGHIHHAEIRMIGNKLYANCGDWVESFTALVEDYVGNLRIIHWTDEEALAAEAEEAPHNAENNTSKAD